MENAEKMAFTIDEFASAHSLSRTKVYELVNTPGFPAIRIGRRILIPVDLLKAWFAQQPTVADGVPFRAIR